MAAAPKYAVDMGWALILSELGIDSQDVLRASRLPLDLFLREAATITSAEYYRLWDALGTVSGDTRLPLRLAEVMTAEAFSPALFACLCSQNLDAALKRLAEYKPLIGPMQLTISKRADDTVVEIAGLSGDGDLPSLLAAAELVFFAHLARLGTRQRIMPLWVESPVTLADARAYADWFGCALRPGKALRIAFRCADAERPFLTASPAMWAAFEPSLRRRLSDAETHLSTSGRVRGWLNSSIASGRIEIADAARDLGVSARTLQRRLAQEGTSFQQELDATREKLARHYLSNTRLSIGEIAFLLGYCEQNSFYRAFRGWTNETPDMVRKPVRQVADD